jgi:hypothetical protein
MVGDRWRRLLDDAQTLKTELAIDDATGLAVRIAWVRVGGWLDPALPEFWN